ncbi:MAG TPA: MarR family transcriptional regulator [Ktedonobacterales bacterium]|jgi:DNA-binding MarR family transcriptional regulator
MSNEHRDELLDTVSREVAELQNATDAMDEAVAQRLGINRTDLRCLGLLFARGPLSAGQLASASGLSPGAATTALDRLERAGYALRTRGAHDRRSVLIELTPLARQRIQELYGPVGTEGRQFLERYSDDELRFLSAFLRDGRALQIKHVALLRSQGNAHEGLPNPEQNVAEEQGG